jgi:SPP1 gp7 family putative phage head morphogenesis protein
MRKNKKNIARIRRTQDKLEKAFLKVSKEYFDKVFSKFMTDILPIVKAKDFKRVTGLTLDLSGFNSLLYYYLIKCKEGGRSSGIIECLELKNYWQRRKKNLDQTGGLLNENFFNFLFVHLTGADDLFANSFSIVPRDALNYYKDYSLFLTGVIEEDLLKKAKQTIISSIENGLSIEDTKSFLGNIFRDFEGARLENIARTEMNKAFTGGRIDAFTAPEMEGFIVAVEFTAILDSRTTEICGERHGLVFKIDDEWLKANTPPLHYQCRSTLLPVDKYSLAIEPGLEEKFEAGIPADIPEPLPGFGGTPAKPSTAKKKKRSYDKVETPGKTDKEIWGVDDFEFSFLEMY